jgi:hypothetical protein
MSEHKGLESYMHNPGKVDAAARAPETKDVHAPDPEVKRKPVTPLPAVPTENGRPVFGLDLGERTPMSEAQMGAKGLQQKDPEVLPVELRDII